MAVALSPRQIWGMPIILALVSAGGLLSALLGNGFWDAASWVALLVPIATPLTYGLRRARRVGPIRPAIL